MKITISLVMISLFLPIVFVSSNATASEAGLSDIVVTNTREHLLLYFSVTNCFTEEMKKAIDNGINTTFNFFIKLYETKKFRLDNKIADLKITHEIKYDNLKNIYSIQMSENGGETVSVKDFQEAKKIMSDIIALKVIELQRLKKGVSYQIRMMAELDKIRLPYYLHYVFFFLSLWDFETDWYSVGFRY